MRVLFQRVTSAFIETSDHESGFYRAEIGNGAVIFLGVSISDGETEADKLAKKTAYLRVFEDENGKMNLSAAKVGGEFLVIPNFTLCGDTSHGRRPAFVNAARPEYSEPLFNYFCERLAYYLAEDGGGNSNVKRGIFGADMKVMVENDGPVSIIIDEGHHQN